MRNFVDIMEDAEEKSSFDVTRTATKVVMKLKGTDSARYTKLGRNLLRISQLEEQIKLMKEAVKADTKEMVADLFEADDACRTRVVDTVSFMFKLTKDPKPTETYKYSQILDELQEHLTPELLRILSELKEKHKSISQRSASMSTFDKADPNFKQSEVDESLSDWASKVSRYFKKFKDFILQRLSSYDKKLDALENYWSSLN